MGKGEKCQSEAADMADFPPMPLKCFADFAIIRVALVTSNFIAATLPGNQIHLYVCRYIYTYIYPGNRAPKQWTKYSLRRSFRVVNLYCNVCLFAYQFLSRCVPVNFNNCRWTPLCYLSVSAVFSGRTFADRFETQIRIHSFQGVFCFFARHKHVSHLALAFYHLFIAGALELCSMNLLARVILLYFSQIFTSLRATLR